MQIKINTTQPSLLVKEACERLHIEGHTQVPDDLVRMEYFNGISVVFLKLSEVQFVALEDAAVLMALEYDADQQVDRTRSYDNRFSPDNLTPYEQGKHDAEIDIWHHKTTQYPYKVLDSELGYIRFNSPLEAILNEVRLMYVALQGVSDLATIQENQGYLARLREEFPQERVTSITEERQ